MDSRTIAQNIIDKSTEDKIKRLKKYTWGFGLEHEMQLFHKPNINTDKEIKSYILFDSKNYLKHSIQNKNISKEDKEYIQSIPYEETGRKCNGKIVLKKIPVSMPEIVTENPFSSLEIGKRPIESYIREMREKENKLLRTLYLNDKVLKLVRKYGQLCQYPFGMSSYFKYPINENSIQYKFNKLKNGEDKLYEDYLGSYHITLTLPFKKSTTLKSFIKMHENFANQVQWIEPLLITAFFSSDQKAVGSKEKRIKGSFRVSRIGWGNFAGSDVRKFNKGIGRYANIKSYWRENFNFYENNKVEYCEKLSEELKKKEPGALAGYSSNFRTFGSIDPDRPWHRESGKGMTKPNGVELRIFDHFDSGFFESLAILIIYIAENSRMTKTSKYVYKNVSWIQALHNIMYDGWKAELPITYINELRNNLGLEIKTNSIIAFDILTAINIELYNKNKKGDWAFLLLEKEYKNAQKLPQINRHSWETALMLKLNNNKDLLNNFNKIIELLEEKEITIKSFENIFYKYFSKNNWKRDIKDIIFFLETLEIIKIKYNENGTIKNFYKKKNIIIDNFNVELMIEWSRSQYEKYSKYFKNN